MTDGPDPIRLLDDPATDEGMREALRQASSHLPPIDTTAGLTRLESAIGSGGAAGGAGTGALVAGAVVLALIGGGVWLATRGGGDRAGGDGDASATIAAPEPAREVTREAAPEAVLPVVVPTLDDVEPPAAAPEPLAPEPAATSARTSAPPPTDEASLLREMERIREARRALDTDPARTLALIDESRREMPRSILGEERDALRILALAGLDRDREAAPLARRFLAAHPTSPFAERIRRATSTEP